MTSCICTTLLVSCCLLRVEIFQLNKVIHFKLENNLFQTKVKFNKMFFLSNNKRLLKISYRNAQHKKIKLQQTKLYISKMLIYFFFRGS